MSRVFENLFCIFIMWVFTSLFSLCNKLRAVSSSYHIIYSFNAKLTSATFNNASTRYKINSKACKQKCLWRTTAIFATVNFILHFIFRFFYVAGTKNLKKKNNKHSCNWQFLLQLQSKVCTQRYLSPSSGGIVNPLWLNAHHDADWLHDKLHSSRRIFHGFHHRDVGRLHAKKTARTITAKTKSCLTKHSTLLCYQLCHKLKSVLRST